MSGFYIGVDGKARKIKGGYVGIDGVARKIKKGYIGDENGVARLCYTELIFDPVFANNTWEDVIVACQNNAVPDTWSVGDQKTMTIDGTDYLIDVIGKDHDDYADGSGKAPLTFQLHELYATKYALTTADNNIKGWVNCLMRSTTLPTILSLMQSEVQNNIREVNKFTSIGNKEPTIGITADKLFLLSEIEIFNTTTCSFIGEGTQYAYYANGGETRKYLKGSFENWWERSPAIDNQGYCLVYNGTSNKNVYPSRNNMGLSFAFCF